MAEEVEVELVHTPGAEGSWWRRHLELHWSFSLLFEREG